MLYLTVLSFSGQMVTFLLSKGYTSLEVGIARTVSVAFELSATWMAPLVISRIGAVRGGIWFINWQIATLISATAIFCSDIAPKAAASGLVIGVIASRIGLWGFDLCAQNIVQDVGASYSGRAGGAGLTYL
jgi:iron-regulated transporter 1